MFCRKVPLFPVSRKSPVFFRTKSPMAMRRSDPVIVMTGGGDVGSGSWKMFSFLLVFSHGCRKYPSWYGAIFLVLILVDMVAENDSFMHLDFKDLECFTPEIFRSINSRSKMVVHQDSIFVWGQVWGWKFPGEEWGYVIWLQGGMIGQRCGLP